MENSEVKKPEWTGQSDLPERCSGSHNLSSWGSLTGTLLPLLLLLLKHSEIPSGTEESPFKKHEVIAVLPGIKSERL